ncbi:uncharacterized protein LOC112575406 isoform X2 [Pomacea canaliculata]|uniref:uncharacterized protein LOC112575406 isoform X2 n=1 Tax=Pomacea canaliculata TaxID=400727 RepID=UPI000D73CDD5|nr:uncharacterized protein LOC112575406 isoform X2 [Pomacea canaliculata]
MYHYPPSALLQPQDDCRRETEKGERVSGGGGRIKLYKHALTDYQAAFLAETEIKKKTGANVEIDLNRSPVPGMKIVTISGVPSQIEVAVSLISQITGGKGNLSEEAQTFWLQWVEAAFPNLSSQAYFLPPVYFNRVPMTRDSIAGQDVLVLRSTPRQLGKIKRLAESMGNLLTSSTSPKSLKQQNLMFKQTVMIPSSVSHTSIPQSPFVQDSDVRDDAAMQRVLFSLQSLSEKTQEVLVGLTHLRFGQYLGEPCFSVAAAHLPRHANLPPDLPQNWKQGDFDVLLIHRHYGFITCAVKAFGDNFQEIDLPKKEMENNIRRKLKEAIAQLSKEEAMLSHLVSDIAPGLRITKTIALPNLTVHQVQQAISEDFKLKEDLCGCLGTADPANIPGLCLCCDQLSDPKTPCDVSSHVLRELGHWWQRRVGLDLTLT